MQFASEFVPGATSGNTTEIDIEAPPELVWKALQALRFDDLRVTKLLIGIRSLPGVALGRGPLRRRSGGTRTSPLMEAITSSRFIILRMSRRRWHRQRCRKKRDAQKHTTNHEHTLFTTKL